MPPNKRHERKRRSRQRDTVNWVKIQGLYQANGGELYITIGDFLNDSSTIFQIADSTSNYYGAYYFIDDVNLYALPNANAGRDTTICTNESAQLGVDNITGVEYNWQPTIGLSSSTIGNPTATPTHTTTYILTQTTPCSITTDTVTVIVCFGVGMQN